MLTDIQSEVHMLQFIRQNIILFKFNLKRCYTLVGSVIREPFFTLRDVSNGTAKASCVVPLEVVIEEVKINDSLHKSAHPNQHMRVGGLRSIAVDPVDEVQGTVVLSLCIPVQTIQEIDIRGGDIKG